MMKIKLTKIIISGLVIASALALKPIGASAEWRKDSNGWWYAEGSSWARGERQIDGHSYYFGSDGYLRTGWKKSMGSWRYYDEYGYEKTGWIQDGGKMYYIDAFPGMMAKNKYVDGVYLNSEGVGTKCINYNGIEIDKATGTVARYIGSDTSVVIPREVNGVEIKRIEDGAFNQCKDVVSITIPDSVTFIHPLGLVNCDSLKDITVDEKNKDYTSFDGVLFSKSMSTIIKYPRAKENTSYIIPSFVSDIQGYAFEDCDTLKSITIHNKAYKSTSISLFTFSGTEDNVMFYVENEKTKGNLIKNRIPANKIVLNS